MFFIPERILYRKKQKSEEELVPMAKTKTMTIQKRVESALLNGEALSKANKNRFGAGNPGAVIPSIKIQGVSSVPKH